MSIEFGLLRDVDINKIDISINTTTIPMIIKTDLLHSIVPLGGY